MKRLYTFGCSYTKFQWPTWADFVGSSFEQYENWGKPGSGNYIIASKLYECHYVNNITKDDTVLIMLSSCDRFDYIDNQSNWSTGGNIYGKNHTLSGYFTEIAWNQENALYNTWYNVKTIITLLNTIGCKYKIMKGFDFFSIDGKMDLFDQEMFTRKRVLNIKNYFDSVITGTSLTDFHTKNPITYKFDNGEADGHPTITIHHNWVKENMKEFYKPEMELLCEKWEKMMPNNRKDLLSIFPNNNLKTPFEKDIITKNFKMI
jgi:hypothetical protein